MLLLWSESCTSTQPICRLSCRALRRPSAFCGCCRQICTAFWRGFSATTAGARQIPPATHLMRRIGVKILPYPSILWLASLASAFPSRSINHHSALACFRLPVSKKVVPTGLHPKPVGQLLRTNGHWPQRWVNESLAMVIAPYGLVVATGWRCSVFLLRSPSHKFQGRALHNAPFIVSSLLCLCLVSLTS